MQTLNVRERPARGQPEGLLVLHHGRGSDERDLLPLADLLDPEGRLHVASPQAPLELTGSPGYHWYLVERVGYPNAESFWGSYRQLSELHDELVRRYELEPNRMVLGGFSMGTVMSYALGLGEERPAPAGILALSGFIPTVEGWQPDLARLDRTGIFITHGRNDPVIDVDFARKARDVLQQAGFAVEYEETGAAHHVDPIALDAASNWLRGVL